MENLSSQSNNQEAIDQIMAIRQEAYMMGANDYEIPALDGIIEKLEKRELSSEDALKEAQTIIGRKADYH